MQFMGSEKTFQPRPEGEPLRTHRKNSPVATAPQTVTSPDASVVLTYHEVEPDESSDLYRVTCRQLEEHLLVLSAHRAGLAAQITFDDGHLSNYQHALPLLEKHGLRAIFFVTAGWIETRPEFMTWTQLKEMVSLGHPVQSHGWSHTFLTQCSSEELAKELERSKRTLEDRLSVAVEAISVPGGRWSPQVLEACARAGYKRVYTSEPWMHPEKRLGVDVRGRLMVHRKLGPDQLRRILSGQSRLWFFLRLRHRIKGTLRNLLGDRLYHRLWSWMAARRNSSQKESENS